MAVALWGVCEIFFGTLHLQTQIVQRVRGKAWRPDRSRFGKVLKLIEWQFDQRLAAYRLSLDGKEEETND